MKKRIFSFFTALAVAFTCCIGCQTTVSAANAAETPENQFLYQYNGIYQGVELTKYLGKEAVVNIPMEIGGTPVTAIGDECFCPNKNLKELTMPDTVVSIGKQAFYDCPELENITWSENLKSIGKWAFVRCKIKSVNMPDSLTFLGEDAFGWCESLEEVICSKRLTELNGTFKDCLNLKTIYFPPSSHLTKIGAETFSNCPLEKIELPATVTEIGSEAFLGSLKKITFPKNSQLKKIGDYAFRYCHFEKITLPASLEKMEGWIFDNCNRLNKISFEKNAKIKKIPAWAFAGCHAGEVEIPENVTTIGFDLFLDSDEGYRRIRKINIKGGKIKKIAKGAFNGFMRNGTITVPKQYKKKYTKMFKKQKWYKKTMKIKAVNDM